MPADIPKLTLARWIDRAVASLRWNPGVSGRILEAQVRPVFASVVASFTLPWSTSPARGSQETPRWVAPGPFGYQIEIHEVLEGGATLRARLGGDIRYLAPNGRVWFLEDKPEKSVKKVLWPSVEAAKTAANGSVAELCAPSAKAESIEGGHGIDPVASLSVRDPYTPVSGQWSAVSKRSGPFMGWPTYEVSVHGSQVGWIGVPSDLGQRSGWKAYSLTGKQVSTEDYLSPAGAVDVLIHSLAGAGEPTDPGNGGAGPAVGSPEAIALWALNSYPERGDAAFMVHGMPYIGGSMASELFESLRGYFVAKPFVTEIQHAVQEVLEPGRPSISVEAQQIGSDLYAKHAEDFLRTQYAAHKNGAVPFRDDAAYPAWVDARDAWVARQMAAAGLGPTGTVSKRGRTPPPEPASEPDPIKVSAKDYEFREEERSLVPALSDQEIKDIRRLADKPRAWNKYIKDKFTPLGFVYGPSAAQEFTTRAKYLLSTGQVPMRQKGLSVELGSQRVKEHAAAIRGAVQEGRLPWARDIRPSARVSWPALASYPDLVRQIAKDLAETGSEAELRDAFDSAWGTGVAATQTVGENTFLPALAKLLLGRSRAEGTKHDPAWDGPTYSGLHGLREEDPEHNSAPDTEARTIPAVPYGLKWWSNVRKRPAGSKYASYGPYQDEVDIGLIPGTWTWVVALALGSDDGPKVHVLTPPDGVALDQALDVLRGVLAKPPTHPGGIALADQLPNPGGWERTVGPAYHEPGEPERVRVTYVQPETRSRIFINDRSGPDGVYSGAMALPGHPDLTKLPESADLAVFLAPAVRYMVVLGLQGLRARVGGNPRQDTYLSAVQALIPRLWPKGQVHEALLYEDDTLLGLSAAGPEAILPEEIVADTVSLLRLAGHFPWTAPPPDPGKRQETPEEYGYRLGFASGYAEFGTPTPAEMRREMDPYAKGYMAGRASASRGDPPPWGEGREGQQAVQADQRKEPWELPLSQYMALYEDEIRAGAEKALGFGMDVASFDYVSPDPSGPFKGSMRVSGGVRVGATIQAPFGPARVTRVDTGRNAPVLDEAGARREWAEATHARAVLAAARAGKPVPEVVLRKYPHAAKAVPSTPSKGRTPPLDSPIVFVHVGDAPKDKDQDKLLTETANKAFDTFRDPGRSNAEVAESVAIGVGSWAARHGVPRDALSPWLQVAYGAVWVKQGNLNPGLDLKQVRMALLRGYDSRAKRQAAPAQSTGQEEEAGEGSGEDHPSGGTTAPLPTLTSDTPVGALIDTALPYIQAKIRSLVGEGDTQAQEAVLALYGPRMFLGFLREAGYPMRSETTTHLTDMWRRKVPARVPEWVGAPRPEWAGPISWSDFRVYLEDVMREAGVPEPRPPVDLSPVEKAGREWIVRLRFGGESVSTGTGDTKAKALAALVGHHKVWSRLWEIILARTLRDGDDPLGKIKTSYRGLMP